MSTQRENGYKYKEYKSWEKSLHKPYDYEDKGLVNHIMSKKIHQTSNPVLKYILQYYEKSLVYCMKYIDILNNYKNYLKNNR